MINDRQLEYLLAVHEMGSFTKAAHRLHISQPALSQMIGMIEKEIGSEIFNRRQSPMTLTYEGDLYLKACLQMRQLHRDSLRTLAEIRDERSGRITLGLSLHMSIFLSHRVVPLFQSRFPGFEIRLEEAPVTTLIDKIRTGQVDLALVYEETEADLFYRDITREDIFLLAPRLCGPEESNGDAVDLNALGQEPFILLKKGHGMRSIAERIFLDNGINPPVVLETDSIEVARRLAGEGLGYTFVPASALQKGCSCSILNDSSDRYIRACMKESSWQRQTVKSMVEIMTRVLTGE